ncbi:MAG: hypothetical protein NC930_00845 [Candidatus Omnitrophica bacterium]|nr:hypothetical protein [Candidatus Omnitrophota bacterium]
MPKKKSKKDDLPKPRKIWGINPKTRVEPSGKIYHRAGAKKRGKSWVDQIDWFGEKPG